MPIIVAGMVLLLAILVAGFLWLVVLAGNPERMGIPGEGQPWHQLEPPPRLVRDVLAPSAALAWSEVGDTADRIEWWPWGSLDHDSSTPVIRWEFIESERYVGQPEVVVTTDARGEKRWRLRWS